MRTSSRLFLGFLAMAFAGQSASAIEIMTCKSAPHTGYWRLRVERPAHHDRGIYIERLDEARKVVESRKVEFEAGDQLYVHPGNRGRDAIYYYVTLESLRQTLRWSARFSLTGDRTTKFASILTDLEDAPKLNLSDRGEGRMAAFAECELSESVDREILSLSATGK